MAKNSVVEATRLLLQSSAKAYYSGLSKDAKAAVRRSFSAADTRGKGHISFHDFFDSSDYAAPPGFSWKGLFAFLDADNNGFWEFDEFITLYYINECGLPFCNACGLPIITGGFSCTQCPPPGRDSFDVCLSCYASPVLASSHHHPQTSFVNLVPRYLQSGSMYAKCDSCGTYVVADWYTCEECTSASAAEMVEMNANMATPWQLNQDQQPTHSFTKSIRSGVDLIAKLINLSIQAGQLMNSGLFSG